uniref:Uncharacterized protein n=1 Tax=uncultured bacterium A1Q1_fos_1877 TaxID=1256555 RepID=L7VWA8_9BACT|nr:hypothetical protein [uncultured bacterium A1Q1_fos_1877]
MTVLVPSCSSIVSPAPLPRLIDWIKRISPFAKKNASPSSPRTVFEPPPAVISSAPAPPMTALVPLVNVIVSAAPLAKSVLSALNSVPELLNTNLPLSPSTTLDAPTVVPFTAIASLAAPPMTTL